jgi:hypothetical protein
MCSQLYSAVSYLGTCLAKSTCEIIHNMNNFVGDIVSDLQMIFHFISDYPSVIQDYGADLFIVLTISYCGRLPQSFYISYTCATA